MGEKIFKSMNDMAYHLKESIKPYSTLIISNIKASKIQFQIKQPLIKKRLKYNLQLQIPLSFDQYQQIKSIIKEFPICKLDNHNQIMDEESYLVLEKYEFIFNEILVNNSKQLLKIFRFNLSKTYSILNISINQLNQFYKQISNQQRNIQQLNLICHIQSYTCGQLLSLITLWIDQSIFGERTLTINLNHVKILKLVNTQSFGMTIFLDQIEGMSILLNGILKVVKNQQIFITIETLQIFPNFLSILIIIFQQFTHRGKYLFKFGSQIEITSYQLILNSQGLSQAQTRAIINLMKHPGHYEFICYTNTNLFQQMIQLFKVKPLIRLKYFLPINELTEQKQQLICKMEKQAFNLMHKVFTYIAMFKKFKNLPFIVSDWIIMLLCNMVSYR